MSIEVMIISVVVFVFILVAIITSPAWLLLGGGIWGIIQGISS